MKKYGKIIRYIFAIILYIFALVSFTEKGFISGIIFILSGTLLLPIIDESIKIK